MPDWQILTPGSLCSGIGGQLPPEWGVSLNRNDQKSLAYHCDIVLIEISSIEIVPLLREHIPLAFRLSTQAQWNQTEQEWLRLIELNPDTCLGFWSRGQLAGTGTLAIYGSGRGQRAGSNTLTACGSSLVQRAGTGTLATCESSQGQRAGSQTPMACGSNLAWLGMVLVDQTMQNKGIGRLILRVLSQWCEKKSCRTAGLDATGRGRRLYQKYGWIDVRPIDRWSGILKPVGLSEQTEDLEPKWHEDVIRLDYLGARCDRSLLLRHLFGERQVRGIVVNDGENVTGFAFIRPGREFWHLGPVVAPQDRVFEQLMDGAARMLDGEPIILDVLRKDAIGLQLIQRGLSVQRRLMRMRYGEPGGCLEGEALRAATSLEWG